MCLCFPDAFVRRAQGWLPSEGGVPRASGTSLLRHLHVSWSLWFLGPRRDGEGGRQESMLLFPSQEYLLFLFSALSVTSAFRGSVS